MSSARRAPGAPSRVGEVARTFGVLGLTSFGGPVAHLGYFRSAVVQRRRWLSDRAYGDLVALAQFLPGPASSQVGLALGLLRAGPLGALVAFAVFTLPSALVLFFLAVGVGRVDGPVGRALIAGLGIGAVAVVAYAVTGLARSLAPDAIRASVVVGAVVLTLALPGAVGQLAAIAFGALAGLAFSRPAAEEHEPLRFPVRRGVGLACLAVFATLLVGLPIVSRVTGSDVVALIDVFYRAGALVLGGGHVVLPLLHTGLVEPGYMSDDTFLTGYGLAQAVPGPLFTVASYLGAVTDLGPGGALGSLLATLAIFAPGFLLLVGVAPFWNVVGSHIGVRAAMRGANAAVVGLLVTALFDLAATTDVVSPGPFCLALICFVLLTAWRAPAWAVVGIAALGGLVLRLT
ncbi:chromate efflux transporter [Frigoribacterium sp. VKM Ac-2836]|nr:chromate efflux transporter [Frigoribacterium sp. VKM Ac-2836]NRD27958.1 chromate efflux transporter [Frigoribacterium sp. VKM Ac-2836]